MQKFCENCYKLLGDEEHKTLIGGGYLQDVFGNTVFLGSYLCDECYEKFGEKMGLEREQIPKTMENSKE